MRRALCIVLAFASTQQRVLAFTLPAFPSRCATLASQSRLVAPIVASEGIQAALKERMKAAMKAKSKQELGAIRLALSAMTTKGKEDGQEELSDAQAIAVLTKLGKMRKESIEMYEKAGEAEKAEAERFELTLIEEYLPAMAEEATVKGWISEAISEVCPNGPDKKMMGKVMGALNKAHGGEFDNKDASQWVREMLG